MKTQPKNTEEKKKIEPINNKPLQGFESEAYKKKLEPFGEQATEFFRKLLNK